MTERLIKNILSEELFGIRICEDIIQSSMINSVYNELMLEKLLIGEPITVPELRDLLHKKILNFEFVKLDGNVRPAKGTTMMKYIPKDAHPTGDNPSSDKVAAFYDLDKGEWRSVSNKSKEIVIQKDKETGKPKVVISDKKPKEEPKEGKPPKEKGVSKRPIQPISKPVVKPSIVPKEIPPIPKPAEVEPEVEETPLNIEDTNITADKVKDQDIIVSEPDTPPDIDSVEAEEKEIEIPDRADITFPEENEEEPNKEDITFPDEENEESQNNL